MLPKNLTKKYLLNSIIYWILAVLFSLSLTWFFLNHLGLEFSLRESAVTSLLVILILILLWTFKKMGLLVMAVALLIRLFYVYLQQDFSFEQAFEPLLNLYRDMQSSILWTLGTPVSKPFLPEDASIHFTVLASILGFLVLWLRPLPLAALMILVIPLFFYMGLSDISQWIGWFFMGLVPIVIAMTFITTMRGSRRTHYQLPSLPVILSLLLLTLASYLLITPEQIYSPRANQWILENFGGGATSQVSPFTLSDVGYNNSLGGPINLSNRPFMEVSGINASFYLRGSVYDKYDRERWSKSQTELFELTDETESTKNHFNRIFDITVHTGSPPISIIPRNDETSVIFHGGKPFSFRFPNTHFSVSSEEGIPDYEIYFNSLGDVLLNQPLASNGYDVETWLANDDSDMVLNYFAASGQPIPRRERETTYEDITLETHPELWELVYNQDQSLDEIHRIYAIRDYFKHNFHYRLDVDELEYDEDVVEALLRSGEGYCTYYATALALLLRDAGFETRYAEGFLIPKDENLPFENAERLILENQAHAWTEIDLGLLGYIPIDATPSAYYSDLSTIAEVSDSETDESETTEPELPFDDRPEFEEEGQYDDLESEALDTDDSTNLTSERWWLILPAYLLWRVLVWVLRHNKRYLHLRYKPKQLVKKIWPDLLHLYELQGIKLRNEDTLRTSLNRVLNENSYWSYWNDREEREGILTMLEEVHFSHHENDFKHLDEFLDYYASVENKTRQKMKRPLWFLKRFLWSRRHPL